MTIEPKLRKIILERGADVCGFASIGCFNHAPEGFSPRDLYSGCQSVVAIGVALPKGLFEADARLIYSYYNAEACRWLDQMTFQLANQMEVQFACIAVPMPSDSPYEYWEKDNLRGKGLLSMKHVAELCGLGRLGKSTLLLNPQYGNRLVVGCILTDLPLETEAPCESICIPGCTKCIDGCPVHAIGDGCVNQKKCRQNSYGKTARGFDVVLCNRCRTLCPMRFGKVAAKI